MSQHPQQHVYPCYNCWRHGHSSSTCPEPRRTVIQKETLRIHLGVPLPADPNYQSALAERASCHNCFNVTGHIASRCPEPARTILKRDQVRIQKGIPVQRFWYEYVSKHGYRFNQGPSGELRIDPMSGPTTRWAIGRGGEPRGSGNGSGGASEGSPGEVRSVGSTRKAATTIADSAGWLTNNGMTKDADPGSDTRGSAKQHTTNETGAITTASFRSIVYGNISGELGQPEGQGSIQPQEHLPPTIPRPPTPRPTWERIKNNELDIFGSSGRHGRVGAGYGQNRALERARLRVEKALRNCPPPAACQTNDCDQRGISAARQG